MQGSGYSGDRLKSVWQFDPHALQPGDVVLETGHSLVSAGIRLFDWGRYSHALIWLDGTDFLEAVGTGVRVISFARFLIRDPKDWLVLRHPDPDIGMRAATKARAFAHMLYDRDGAIATKLPGNRQASPVAMFCSQVIAKAYADAGAPLVEKASHKVTPNGLRRKSVLIPVDPIPLVEQRLTPEQLIAAQSFLDRDSAYVDTDMSREMAISQEVHAMVMGLFPAKPHTEIAPDFGIVYPPRNLGEAFQVLQFLDQHTASKISDAMLPELECRGYFNFGRVDLAIMIERLQTQKAQLSTGAVNFSSMAEWGKHYSTAYKGHSVALARHSNNADAYHQLYAANFPLSIYKRMEQMHREIAVLLGTAMSLEEAVIVECMQGLKIPVD